MNKSLLTNALSAALIPIGALVPAPLGPHILTVGLFATSGAITNWLAIYMLFERVPGLYGSGVIPARFEEFKQGIHDLIMDQFFTEENLDRFFAAAPAGAEHAFDFRSVAGLVDYDMVFDRMKEVITGSSFGSMLGMFGGEKALEPLRDPFKEKMKGVVEQILDHDQVRGALLQGMHGSGLSDLILQKTEGIVKQRLDDLTPGMVKEIVQNMIRQHLGWLVVWGGVFGGLIGLVTSFLR